MISSCLTIFHYVISFYLLFNFTVRQLLNFFKIRRLIVIPILEEYAYLLYVLEIILIMLAAIIVIHAIVVMLWGYSQTGDFLVYLRNFYHNVYGIDF